MASVVSESMGRVLSYSDAQIQTDRSSQVLDLHELRALARDIIDKEPSEIRDLLRQDPDLLRGWVTQLKAQHLRSASGSTSEWHEALDHIRLSTLSPLRFAAE